MSIQELYQDKVWTQSNGVTMKLKKMGPSHRANLLRWIERNGAKLLQAELNAATHFGMFLQGDMAIDAIDAEIAHLEDESPASYVDGLPLVIKLRKLVAKDAVLPLAERAALDLKAKAAAEQAKRDAILAGFDEPDPPKRPTPKQHTLAEDAAFEREWGPLPRRTPGATRRRATVIREPLRPHPASQDDSWRATEPVEAGWGRMSGGHDTIDGWPDTRFAPGGDGWG